MYYSSLQILIYIYNCFDNLLNFFKLSQIYRLLWKIRYFLKISVGLFLDIQVMDIEGNLYLYQETYRNKSITQTELIQPVSTKPMIFFAFTRRGGLFQADSNSYKYLNTPKLIRGRVPARGAPTCSRSLEFPPSSQQRRVTSPPIFFVLKHSRGITLRTPRINPAICRHTSWRWGKSGKIPAHKRTHL